MLFLFRFFDGSRTDETIAEHGRDGSAWLLRRRRRRQRRDTLLVRGTNRDSYQSGRAAGARDDTARAGNPNRDDGGRPAPNYPGFLRPPVKHPFPTSPPSRLLTRYFRFIFYPFHYTILRPRTLFSPFICHPRHPKNRIRYTL